MTDFENIAEKRIFFGKQFLNFKERYVKITGFRINLFTSELL